MSADATTIPKPASGTIKQPDRENLMPTKILVCDDERHIVRLIQVNLERQGYTVTTAFDGKEGLEKIRTERPDLAVLDVTMPSMHGFEVLTPIRRAPEREHPPCLPL